MLVQIDYRDRQAPERSFWQMKETRAVPRESTGVLEALWLWREQEAQRRNWPPFKILINKVLVQLALVQPSQLSDLYAIHGLSETGVERYGTGAAGCYRRRSASTPASLACTNITTGTDPRDAHHGSLR